MDEQYKVQEQGLTFGEIFRVLKKGIVLLTICLVVGVILCTSCLLVMREFIGTTSYETEITFRQASINEDEGFNPSTTVGTLIKSNEIITKALNELKYSADDQQKLLNAGLASKLSAYTTEVKDDKEGIAYPYKVVLSLKKMGSKVLSKAQSSALIEELTKQVILELINSYKYEIKFDALAAIDYSQYNYLQVYDKLDNALDSVNAFKDSISSDALNYTKNGNSIKAVLSKFDAIDSELNVVKQKLINNKIVNASASSTELDYATYNATYYTQKKDQLNERITDYAQLLKDTKPDITVMTGGVTVDALNKYYELVDIYNELQNEYTITSAKAVEWTTIKDAYSSATIEDETVKTQYNTIVTNYNNAYRELESVVNTYNEDNYASNLVAETKTVQTIKNSAISPLIIVLVDVVVIAVVMVIVFLVENHKENKKKQSESAAESIENK